MESIKLLFVAQWIIRKGKSFNRFVLTKIDDSFVDWILDSSVQDIKIYLSVIDSVFNKNFSLNMILTPV